MKNSENQPSTNSKETEMEWHPNGEIHVKKIIVVKKMDFDDMSSFFHCEIDDAVQYINLEYGV